MQKWEYFHVDVKFYSRFSVGELYTNGELAFKHGDKKYKEQEIKISDFFAKLGGEAWELVTAAKSGVPGCDNEYIFKRPVA